jgi:hypothetical protein
MRFYIVTLLVFVCALPARAEIDPNGEGAPWEIVERARQLVAQRDYTGVEAMIAQIDTQYRDNHGEDYFRALMGIWRSVGRWKPYPAEPDYQRIWLSHKVHWKLLLTPYSRIEDALTVQTMRDGIAGFGAPSPWGNFDRDQYVALRNDAFAMLISYRDSLRSRIIPRDQSQLGPGPKSVAVSDPKEAKAPIAKQKAQEAELTRNSDLEQYALIQSLSRLPGAAVAMIQDDYSWPPEDDAAVRYLLDTFPPAGGEQERVLRVLAARRRSNLEALKVEAAKRKASP